MNARRGTIQRFLDVLREAGFRSSLVRLLPESQDECGSSSCLESLESRRLLE